MSKLEVSIIIPCYNSEKTLLSAVQSCYKQGLKNFEIILVDDGSGDNTRELMNVLAAKHDNILVHFHENNRGGGAARNTAIRLSKSKYIFPLDSDDILAPNVLKLMLDFLEKENVDGVIFHERRFFNKHLRFPHNIHKNTIFDRVITFHDIFSPQDFLFNNFLYKREAYDKTPGYPEHHGFDTQSFEIRFLVSGGRAKVCPGSLYYHRQTTRMSYFDRERYAGNFSKNMLLVLEDMLFLFSHAVRKEIATFDIIKNNRVGGDNLYELLRELYVHDSNNFFICDVTQKDVLCSFEKYVQNIKESDVLEDIFCKGVYQLRMGNNTIALGIFERLLKVNFGGSVLLFLSTRALNASCASNEYVKRQGIRATLSSSNNSSVYNRMFLRTIILRLRQLISSIRIFFSISRY